MSRAAPILALALLALSASAQTLIRVPLDHPTIQAAINAAAPGDRIEVAAGTYPERLMIDKDLELVGVDGAATTAIDGQGLGTVVTIELTSLTLSGFTITGGQGDSVVNADSRPGGIDLIQAFVEINDCLITANTGGDTPVPINSGSERGGAGGLRITGGWARMCRCRILANTGGIGADRLDLGLAQDGGAGGLEAVTIGTSTGPVLEIIDCEFRDNEGGRGGDRALGTGVFTLGTGGRGGPGAILARGDVIVDRSRFIDNVGASGGASDFAGRSGQGAASVSTFVDLVDQGGSLTATSSLFLRNRIDPGALLGSGASVVQGEHQLRHCTVVGNLGGQAAILGTATAPPFPLTANDQSIVRSSIVRGNLPLDIGQSPGIPPFVPAAQPDVAFSNVGGGYPGVGNIDADPVFLAPSGDDFRLARTSPGIDQGDPFVAAGPELDLAGEPRVTGPRVDMGADEFRIPAAGLGNLAAGPSLEVDGSSDTLRRLDPLTAFNVALVAPAGAPFLLFARPGPLGPADARTLPFGIGPALFDPSLPGVILVASSFAGSTGVFPATVAPWSTTVVGGLPAGLTLTLQAVVLDGPAGLRASNGITLGFDT